MAALRYRRFLKLCEEWPVDETKRGRDLGAYLRQRVAQAFREGENTQVTGGREVGGVGAGGGRGDLRMRRRRDRLHVRGAHVPASCGVRRLRLRFLLCLHRTVAGEAPLRSRCH